MTDPRPSLAEMAQLVAMLEDAGLVEVHEDATGQVIYRRTQDGVRVGNMLALADESEAEAVLEALLPVADDG